MRQLDQAQRLFEVTAPKLPIRGLDDGAESVGYLLGALPDLTSLIEFIEYRRDMILPLEFYTTKFVYAAIVLSDFSDGRRPTRVNLGPAAQIDAAIHRYRTLLEDTGLSAPVDRASREVARLVWDPIVPQLGKSADIIIAPDAVLWGLPFAGLRGLNGRYLVEDFSIQYIEHSRELAAAARESTSSTQSLLSNYDIPGSVRPWDNDPESWSDDPVSVMTIEVSKLEHSETSQASQGRGLLLVGNVDFGGDASHAQWRKSPDDMRESWHCFERRFSPLPATEVEIMSIAAIGETVDTLEGVDVLAGRDATLARVLAQMPRHRVVHLATHSYYADPTCMARLDPSDRRSRLLLWAMERQPMLLSGLALTGANRGAGLRPHTAGRLTAQELSALDLRGVDLVVLSACSTALGELVPGQGVLGLRRDSIRLAWGRS